MTGARWVVLAAAWLSAGCEIYSGSGGEEPPPPNFSQPPSGGFGGFDNGGEFGGSAAGPAQTPSANLGFVPPTVRETIVAPKAPPAISGGTLLITRDGKHAVAADPDRDRVSIVSIQQRAVLRTVTLMPGDEPGRVVEDASGRVHVALRRGGALVTIDVATGNVTARRAVGGLPRGVAFEEETDQVHVACAGGQLVSFQADGGDPVRTLQLDIDLRDVIATRDGLLVSRFKSAELLRITPSGKLVGRTETLGIQRASNDQTIEFDADGNPVLRADDLVPAGAWRTVPSPDGSALMLHQYALSGPVVVGEPTVEPGQPVPPRPPSGGGYGAPTGTCGGIVQSGISRIDADGTVTAGAPMLGTVLPVDAATSFDGEWTIIAVAGAAEPVTRLDGTVGQSELGRVQLYQRSNLAAATGGPTGCSNANTIVNFAGQATAVAFNPSITEDATGFGVWFAAQTRDPASIVLIRDVLGTPPVSIALGGQSVFDTGHEQFHRNSGGGIACASCHLEGTEDGHVWQFDPIGPRRTQAIDVGLEGTAPFHWDGDMTDFDMLVSEVFVHRMGGSDQGVKARNALSNWIFSLEPRQPLLPSDNAAALRGKEIFTSEGAQCSTCHAGEKLMSNTSVEVGTTKNGHKLQVPSLVGVAYRAPFLHDGRAKTLRDRFDPSKGGGDKHGRTSHLTQAQVDDLIAYLSSI